MKLSKLKGNDRNPRIIKNENAEHLKNSISLLGDLSCIVFNERTGKLIWWHQRKEVITKLIGEDPEVEIIKEYDEPNEVGTTKEGFINVSGENYKVRFVDFSEEDEALAIIVANDKRNQGEYDFWMLPTVIDIANTSNLSVDFGMMDFAESLDLWFNFIQNPGDEEEEVSFTAKKWWEIDTNDFNGETNINLRFNEVDYQRVIRKLNEVKSVQNFTTYEDAIIFLLF